MFKPTWFVMLLVFNCCMAHASAQQQARLSLRVPPLSNNFQALDIEAPPLVPQKHQTFKLHYSSVKTLAKLLLASKPHLLSAQGVVLYAASKQLLWVSDNKRALQRVARFVRQWDKKPQQVLVRVYIVNIDKNYLSSLGLHFFTFSADHATSFSTHAGELKLPLAKLLDSALLGAKLEMLQRLGHAQLLSSPELLTINKHMAVIAAGEQVPYQEQTRNGGTSTVFKKAALSVNITPIILPHRHVQLKLTITQDKPAAVLVNGVPVIRTQQLKTTVMLRNRATLVLGGIYEQVARDNRQGVPVLQRIPLLGALLRSHRQDYARRMLLIFVTPTIV